ALALFRQWSDLSAEQRSNWAFCGVFVVGSFFSIIMTGPLYSHYFTQLAPGLAMFAAAPFTLRRKTFDFSKANCAKFVFGSALIGTVIFRTAGAEWSALTNRLLRGEQLSYGTAYEIANFIKGQGQQDFSLFVWDNHLVYWLLDRRPPTLLATHPSNLLKPFIRKYLEPDSRTTADALRNVFLREPTFVVLKFDSWSVRLLDTASSRFLRQELTTRYELVANIDGNQVFQ